MKAGARRPPRRNPPVEHHYAGVEPGPAAAPRQEAWPAPLVTEAPHAPQSGSQSRLEALLNDKAFVVTSECSPPDSADPADVLARVRHYEGWVDAPQRHRRPGRALPHVELGVSLSSCSARASRR